MYASIWGAHGFSACAAGVDISAPISTRLLLLSDKCPRMTLSNGQSGSFVVIVTATVDHFYIFMFLKYCCLQKTSLIFDLEIETMDDLLASGKLKMEIEEVRDPAARVAADATLAAQLDALGERSAVVRA